MKAAARLFALFLSLFMLAACATASEPAEMFRPDGVATLIQPTLLNPDSPLPAVRMKAPRATHTATLLNDGSVLVVGGFREEGTSEISIASAEIYDPTTNSFSLTGDMNVPRRGHTATLLTNGQVLIAGGWGANGRISAAELYDPKTGQFDYAAEMVAPRASMTATLLQNGQVLIAGGDSARDTPQLIAEIYDPVTNTFAQSGALNRGRSAHTATVLKDGKVLLVGGRSSGNVVLASAEIYDPSTGMFTYASDLNMVRHKHAAVLLEDGNVLVIGGSNENDWTGQYSSAEIYNSSTGTFETITDLNRERFKLANAAVLLNNGNVFVGGGNRQVELFDIQSQRFVLGETLGDDYYFSVATHLEDDRVLITGGYDSRIQPSENAWIYKHG